MSVLTYGHLTRPRGARGGLDRIAHDGGAWCREWGRDVVVVRVRWGVGCSATLVGVVVAVIYAIAPRAWLL